MVCGQGGRFGLLRGGITFDGLGLQGHLGGSSVRNIFKGSFTEYGTGAGRAVFEGGFKFAASEKRNKFYSTASADQGAIG